MNEIRALKTQQLSERVRLRITKGTHAAIVTEATNQDRSVSYIIRETLEEKFGQKKND